MALTNILSLTYHIKLLSFRILIKFSSPKTTTSLPTTLSPSFPIENKHTILI